MSANLAQQDKQYLWHPFTPMKLWLESDPLVIDHGQGVYLYDTEGNQYIDAISSLWCNVHGHNHPHINAAIRAQLDKIAHSTLLGLASGPSITLARKLVEITPQPLTRVFYSDAGATAVEIALKIAFQYWRNLGQTQKQKFVALRQSYHGDTVGSISVGGIETFHQIFGPLTFAAHFAPSPHPYRFDGSPDQCRDHALNQMEQILKQHKDTLAAIIVEPLVQGAAGLIVQPKGYLAGVAQLAQKYDVLLIVDEVATGFGRTGTMFACSQESVNPDLMCLAKGITGGYMPLAATLATDRVFQAFLTEPWPETTFYHGHTYTGNALACAAAIASLEVFQNENTIEKLPPKIQLISQYLKQIEQLDYVGNTRQCGLITGIELVADKHTKQPFDVTRRIGAQLCQTIRKQGVIMRPLSDTLVLMPPLAIPIDTLEILLQTLTNAIKNDLPKIVST